MPRRYKSKRKLKKEGLMSKGGSISSNMPTKTTLKFKDSGIKDKPKFATFNPGIGLFRHKYLGKGGIKQFMKDWGSEQQ